MTSNTQLQIKRLFKLVELSNELGDLVNLKLVDQWNLIREENGLAQTLTLLQEYFNDQNKSESPAQTTTPETQHSNQDPPLVR
jgi:hypothetical protein